MACGFQGGPGYCQDSLLLLSIQSFNWIRQLAVSPPKEESALSSNTITMKNNLTKAASKH